MCSILSSILIYLYQILSEVGMKKIGYEYVEADLWKLRPFHKVFTSIEKVGSEQLCRNDLLRVP